MIPIELKLTNFISYGVMEEPLSFTSFDTASLCGPNGHGKSTLLDAVTWALWGRARGVDGKGAGTDDLIKAGETGMAVEFSFELENHRYRVVRVRERKNKAGVTRLDFSILDDDEARSLNGETIAKTQEKIDRTLRMDFETFTNSAFILQGRADSFMTKNSNERKGILVEILGLSRYEELENAARGTRRELERRLERIDAVLVGIESELALRPAHESSHKAAMDRAGELRAEMENRERSLAELREKKAQLDATAARLSDLKGRVFACEAEIVDLESQLEEAVKEKGDFGGLIERASEIDENVERLARARTLDEELRGRLARHSEVCAAVEKAKGEISTAEAGLKTRLDQLRRELVEVEKIASSKDSLAESRDKCSLSVDGLAALESERDESRERFKELSRRKNELVGGRPSLGVRLAELENNIESIVGADAACPLCKKGLSRDERDSLLGGMEKELAEAQTKVAEIDADISRLEKDIRDVESNGTSLTKRIREKDALQERLGRLVAEAKAAEEAARKASELAKEIAEAESLLAESKFAPEASARLKKMQSELVKLAYDGDKHDKVRADTKRLAFYEREAARLEEAKRRIISLDKNIGTLKDSIEKKKMLVIEDKGGLEKLETRLKAAPANEEIPNLEAELVELAREEKGALANAAVSKDALSRCDRLVAEREEALKERTAVACGVRTYSDLTTAFSKKGIPALIIENAVPEIEEEANEILRRLTDGRMSVRFLTQKEQRTTDNFVETLDLVISDGELGERKYELFSGGEAFRINFAIRIALSKLLTRRAGARLEMLVIDEGFGTQDEEGRDRLVEAISSISSDFRKIIVITHLDELKEAFPARIEVVKTPGIGSVATIV